VKQIIIALSLAVKAIYEDPTQDFHWNAFPVEQYLRSQYTISASCFKDSGIIFSENIYRTSNLQNGITSCSTHRRRTRCDYVPLPQSIEIAHILKTR
jgi:hypothetical protein